MEDETTCKYVSSRGLLKSCDIRSATPHSSIRHLIGYNVFQKFTGNTFYICSAAIPYFVAHVFPSIQTPFRLVTGDCDESCPSDLFPSRDHFLAFIEDTRVISWWSQNCIETGHPKLKQMPIGQDYHTLSHGDHSWGPGSSPKKQEQLLDAIREKAAPFWERKCMAHANFHFSMTTKFAYDRHDALNQIPRELVYYETERCWRIQTWKSQSEYAFVVSPHGNGLDCHRTWEALCLGCIPIMKTSDLDPMFEGLPVLIVKQWSDVTKELMERTVEEYKTREFKMEKLLLSYWMDKIRG